MTARKPRSGSGGRQYLLRLYVTGSTPRSKDAILNIKRVCDEELQGQYELEVVDIYQRPEMAKKDDVVAAPTLIRELPLPLRRLVGDLSNRERILIGLEIAPQKKER